MSDVDEDIDLLTLPPAVEALLFDDILRRDFVAFGEMVLATIAPGIPYEPNWHVEAIARAVAEVRSGAHPRLIVNCPPRSLKSTIISVALPAFILGHDPTQRIIVASYGAELSRKLASDFRLVVNSPWFRRLFPNFQIARDTEMELVTTAAASATPPRSAARSPAGAAISSSSTIRSKPTRPCPKIEERRSWTGMSRSPFRGSTTNANQDSSSPCSAFMSTTSPAIC